MQKLIKMLNQLIFGLLLIALVILGVMYTLNTSILSIEQAIPLVGLLPAILTLMFGERFFATFYNTILSSGGLIITIIILLRFFSIMNSNDTPIVNIFCSDPNYVFEGTNDDWQKGEEKYAERCMQTIHDVNFVLVPKKPLSDLTPFWMSQAEITVKQYKACVDVGNCTGLDSINSDISLPIRSVRREDASKYCNWIAGDEGRDYYLPSYTQWYYALTGFDEFTSSWHYLPRHDGAVLSGNEPLEFDTDRKDKSWVGAYDMIGNLQEWLSDSDGQGNPYMIGGSYRSDVRLDDANLKSETAPFQNTGFRCVLPFDAFSN